MLTWALAWILVRSEDTELMALGLIPITITAICDVAIVAAIIGAFGG